MTLRFKPLYDFVLYFSITIKFLNIFSTQEQFYCQKVVLHVFSTVCTCMFTYFVFVNVRFYYLISLIWGEVIYQESIREMHDLFCELAGCKLKLFFPPF